VHSFTHDYYGNLTFGVNCPRESLTGTGTIGGGSVDCSSPMRMVRLHSGYELDVDDDRDVAALCERFSTRLRRPRSRRGRLLTRSEHII
jgi:hypothetical protein